MDRLRAAAAVVAVALFSTGFDTFAFRLGVGPKPSLIVLAFTAAALAVLAASPRRPIGLLRSPLLAWIAFYVGISIAWALGSGGRADAFEELDARLRSMLLLLALCVLFDAPRSRRAAALALGAAVVVASALNVAELLQLVTFPEVASAERTAGRAAGAFVNPNGAGMAIAFGLSLSLPELSPRWRGPVLLVSGLGVVATFSRGASVCFAALTLWFVARKVVRARLVLAAGTAVAAALLLAGGGGAAVLESTGTLNRNTLARVQLEQGDSGRLDRAREAWQSFEDSPVVGNGLGATVAPHNEFLALAGDQGLLGLLALPALGVALVLANRAAAPFAMTLMLAGFLTHNLLEDRAALVALALASLRRPGVPSGRPGAEPG